MTASELIMYITTVIDFLPPAIHERTVLVQSESKTTGGPAQRPQGPPGKVAPGNFNKVMHW
jgi:hypothetical protein